MALLLYHFFCLMPGIIYGMPMWRAGLKRPTLIECGLLGIASVTFCGAALLLYNYMGDYLLSSQNTHKLLVQVGYNTTIFVPLSLYFIVGNSTMEELFWRGVVMTRLEELRPRSRHFGIVYSSVAYALFHYPIMRLVLYPGWAEFGTLMLVGHGAILAMIYKRTKSIVLPILVHALLADLTAIVLIFALFRRLGLQSPM
jgi:membrane protease YdiL (CAAX protease family)